MLSNVVRGKVALGASPRIASPFLPTSATVFNLLTETPADSNDRAESLWQEVGQTVKRGNSGQFQILRLHGASR